MRILRLALAVALGVSLAAPSAVPARPSAKVAATVTQRNLPKAAEKPGLGGQRKFVKSSTKRAAKKLGPLSVTNATRARSKTTEGSVEGEWVLRTSPLKQDFVARQIMALGASVTKGASGKRLLVKATRAQEGAVLKLIGRLGEVESYEKAVRMRATTAVPSDPKLGDQWGLDRIGGPSAWNSTMGSSDVTIAIVDTGVDLSNPEFAGRIDTENDFDFTRNRPSGQDDEGHGTHVAGIAAAGANDTGTVGVAPNVKILPVKVLDRYGEGTDYEVAEGIEWAADHGADIINMSLGGDFISEELVAAVDYAQAKGVLIVAATGNEEWRVSYPAALPGVIGVGATTLHDKIVGWSNYGPEVDIAAPGTNILSTKLRGGVETMSGTSMATPFVAGAAALVLSANPSYDATQIANALASTAEDRGTPGKDIKYGWGRLNVAKALGQLGGDATGPSAPSDDDVPGLPLPGAVATGTLNEYDDFIDVFQVHLDKGQRLDATITAQSKSLMAMWLAAPNATSVYDSYPIDDEVMDGHYPDYNSVHYVAPRDGDFSIVLECYTGASQYTVKSAITTATASDNYLPGVPIPPSPFSGTLNERADESDIFMVHLEAGQRFAARFDLPKDTWDPYTDEEPAFEPMFGMVQPGAWSRWDEEGMWYEFPCITQRATEAGDYYLDVSTWWGSGKYKITWQIIDDGPDDVLPGTPLVSETTTGTLDYPFDTDDILTVQATKGQRLNVSLESSGTGYVGMGLVDPSVTSLVNPWYLAGSATGSGYDAFSYVIPEDGAYPIDVLSPYGMSGKVSYKLRYTLLDPVSPQLAMSIDTTRPAFGKDIKVEATATDQPSGQPIADQAAELQVYEEGDWWTVDAAMTDATGHVRFSGWAPEYATSLRVVTVQGWDVESASNEVAVKPGASVGVPKALTTPTKVGRNVLWRGALKPWHEPGVKEIKLRFAKLVNRTWKLRFVVTATTYNSNYYESMYMGQAKVKERGKWRLIALHEEDDDNLAAASKPVYFTVR